MTEWVTRAGWGAPQKVNCTSQGSTEGVAIHWVGPGSFAGKDPKATMKQVRGWHLANRTEGYCDIAYNLGVAPGVILEGRSTQGVPRIRTGANGNQTVNRRFHAVLMLIGDGDAAATDEHLRTASEAVVWLRQHAGAGNAVVGHRDLHQTSCPGDYIHSQLGKIKAYADGGAPSPTPPPQPPAAGPLYRQGKVYLGYMYYGNRDSDSVRNLQVALRGHGYTGPVTGGYFKLTDAAVRDCQARHGFGPVDPVGKSFVGPKQAAHLFPQPPYTIIPK